MKEFPSLSLRVQLAQPPEKVFPTHVRRTMMGVLTDADPAYFVVGNHEHTYPFVHFRMPDTANRTFRVLGLGQPGIEGIMALASTLRSHERIVLNKAPYDIEGVHVTPGRLRVGVGVGLRSYVLKTPAFVFDKRSLREQRTGNLPADYSNFLTSNLEWIFGRMGVPFDRKPFLHVEDPQEDTGCVKPAPWLGEDRIRPRLRKATFHTNAFLPPAIGHGVSLGWGVVQLIDEM